MMCEKCSSLTGILVLIFGVLFLIGDLGVWDLWGISWYTIGFLLVGLCYLGKSKCHMCCAKKKK